MWLVTSSPWRDGLFMMVSSMPGSDVCIVRERCLGIGPDSVVVSTKKLAPFFGTIEYDYIMWIDSDIIFKPEDFMKLVNRDVDIVSGLYKRTPEFYTAVRYNPSVTLKDIVEISEPDIEGQTDLIEVSLCGLGFMLVKKGVFESLERPWFLHPVADFLGATTSISEDAYFCMKAQEAGFKLWVDPTVRVGHEKLTIRY